MPEKPKKKTAGLSMTPAARRAAARAQAARAQRGADVFGGDVDELVSRSFVGQGVSAVATAEGGAPPLLPDDVVPPPAPAESVLSSQGVSPWLAPGTSPAASPDPARPDLNAAGEATPAPTVPPGETLGEGTGHPPAAAVRSEVELSSPQAQDLLRAAVSLTGSASDAPTEASGHRVAPPEPDTAHPSSPEAGPVVPALDEDRAGRHGQALPEIHAVVACVPQVSADERQARSSGDGTRDPEGVGAEMPVLGGEGGTGREPAPRRGAVGTTGQAVLRSWTESTMDLKLGKNQWHTIPFRFAPDLVTVLSSRVAQDREGSGRPLTVAQYVDAAMRLYLPGDTNAQLSLAEDFFLRREGDVPAGRQSSHRVSPGIYEIASRLPNDLRRVGRARTAVHVYSAAMDLFLTALKNEGPLI